MVSIRHIVLALVCAAIMAMVAGCGGSDANPGDLATSPSPGETASLADAAAACTVIARAGPDLPDPTADLNDPDTLPAATVHRLQGAAGLASAAARSDPRLGPVGWAAERLDDDLQTLDVRDFASATEATVTACRDLRLPSTVTRSSAQADAALGCAAASRARDRFSAASPGGASPGNDDRFSGIALLLQAAFEADSTYQTLAQLGQALPEDLRQGTVDELSADGAALLTACGNAGFLRGRDDRDDRVTGSSSPA
ncbi:exported hypothetical protein [Frankia canadensis]|uniref:Lipoprotein n=1 Tax=Frankia canadensis TaxID=1836972 RepID=A0A2I2L1C8_9ACTN|nr:hypothetical protein [Frankia canadensis]SNQ51715.1 exported hypothetical protein [Frankia canadensis]SOU59005.1 exported hypothetical protein [Frankia canadensis]